MESILESFGALSFVATPYSLLSQTEVKKDLKGFCAYAFPNRPYTDGIKNVLEHRGADESYERYLKQLAVQYSPRYSVLRWLTGCNERAVRQAVLSIRVDPTIFDSAILVERLKSLVVRTMKSVQIVVIVPGGTDPRVDALFSEVGVKVCRPVGHDIIRSGVTCFDCSVRIMSAMIQAVWEAGFITPDHPQYSVAKTIVEAITRDTGAEVVNTGSAPPPSADAGTVREKEAFVEGGKWDEREFLRLYGGVLGLDQAEPAGDY